METAFSTLDVNGQTTRVLRQGEGPEVVVLHGWGGRIESMMPAVSCLSEAFMVTALDLPGFGESPPPTAPWGTAEYSGFVAGCLEMLGMDRAHLVAHSYGAKTSLMLAVTRPELVGKMVLVGSSGLRTPPSFAARAKRALSKGARAAGRLGAPGRSVRDAVYARIASQDYRDAGRMRDVLVKVVNEDLTDILPQVRASTLLVWGTEMTPVPVAHARTMERLIPDAGLVLFEGAGHFAYLDEPARFCRVARHFLGAPLQT